MADRPLDIQYAMYQLNYERHFIPDPDSIWPLQLCCSGGNQTIARIFEAEGTGKPRNTSKEKWIATQTRLLL